jgi:hypothetical protein
VRFDDDAGLDASEVQDMRGGGGGGIGGRVALRRGPQRGRLVIYFLLSQVGGVSSGGGTGGSLGGLGSG